MEARASAHPFDVWALNPFDWRHLVSFYREPRGAVPVVTFGMPMSWHRLARAPFTEFPLIWRMMMTARYGGRLAAIGATAMLTAAVFILPAKAAETDAKAVIKTYSDIALAKYEDSLTTAQALDKAVDALLSSNEKYTLPVLMTAVRAGRLGAINWGAVQAGVVVMTIPCLIVFLLLQRYYMRGLMAGAVK
jgi:hypothetical protein